MECRDPEAALRAWDEYLAHAPLQWLRIEAEYNRALCLVRLGRTEEAYASWLRSPTAPTEPIAGARPRLLSERCHGD